MGNPITIENEQAMALFAKECAIKAQNKDVFTLQGPMGAGKSCFARYFIRHLCGNNIDVPSPTFTLVQQYDTPCVSIWHFDLYRLENPDEIYEIGWEEALHDGVCLIEWPERLGSLLPHKRHDIVFEITSPETRQLTYNMLE